MWIHRTCEFEFTWPNVWMICSTPGSNATSSEMASLNPLAEVIILPLLCLGLLFFFFFPLTSALQLTLDQSQCDQVWEQVSVQRSLVSCGLTQTSLLRPWRTGSVRTGKAAMGEHGLQPRSRSLVKNKNHRNEKIEETATASRGEMVSGHWLGRSEGAKP